jgi:hypothetical protein
MTQQLGLSMLRWPQSVPPNRLVGSPFYQLVHINSSTGLSCKRTWDGWVWAQRRFVKRNDNGTWSRITSNWCVESVALEWSENDLIESSDNVIEISQEESAQYVKDIAEGRSPVTDM